MGLILKYVKRTSSGGFEYRRRVPKDIVDQIAKREFKQVLGGTEREALRSYPNIHGHFERQIEEARASNSHIEAAQNGKLGRRELWEVASCRVRDMLDGANDPDEIRDIIAESILDGYPKGPSSDKHEGELIGVPELDRLIVGLLRNPSAGPPKPTLLDAIERYRSDKYGDNVNRPGFPGELLVQKSGGFSM